MAANQMEQKREVVSPTGRPLQRISWSEKIADKYSWWKENITYYISISNFNFTTTPTSRKNLRQLYQIYNNQFPMTMFSHITDPLNAAEASHKKYPAKIRPSNMLRTNIDLLLGEYPMRPFGYQVANLGEDAFNSFLEGLNGAIHTNLEEHFLAVAQKAMKDAGHDIKEIPQDEEIELPDSVKQRFTSSYKDNLAIRGQKFVKRAVREYQVRQKMLKMFKDWLIAGSVFSYKNIEFGNLIYERVSPLEIDFDKSPNVDFVEDGEWVIRRQLLTVSDVVDRYYDELTNNDHEELERRTHWVTPFSMYNYLQSEFTTHNTYSGKVPVYHVQWKGRIPVRTIEYTDPLTGEVETMTIDEDTPLSDNMRVIKSEWVNEVYEGTRIGDNIFTRMRPVPVQRNEMNNMSTCKLSYNGRMFSDVHAENLSVLEMGLPYAIMYMITNYSLEKTIAKNKGKITLIDQNAIPKKNGWTEEKFFYYADALGYALVDRNQIGVDKSFNQYQVLDMSLFDHIEKLILLRNSFSDDWDKVLGINPQRKAQIGSGDGLGTTQTALATSSVITAMIFNLFEEFSERELQGFLDFSKFINTTGLRGAYNMDDYDRELLMADPNSYASAELGLFIKHSAEELMILNKYKEQVQAMIQNGVKQSTILEIQQASNLAELMGKLKMIEEIEMEQAQSAEASAQEHEAALIEIQNRFKELESLLKINEINAEWDRRDANEMIKGEYTLFGFGGDGDNNDNGIPDAAEITKRITSMQQQMTTERIKAAELNQQNKEHKDKMRIAEEQIKLAKETLASKERIENKKAKVALKNKVSGEK